jgi:hypothetical protein
VCVTCSPGAVGLRDGGLATLVIRADVSGTSVATVVVGVAAPDIPTTLVFNIPVANGVALGTITIPAGSNRAITLRAYDAGGVQTHEGSATLNVQAGTNPAISLVLRPLTGDLPITVTLGSFRVAVTPSANALANGATVQLSAAITDWSGNPTSGTVSWATDAPGIAVVNASGLVTAIGAGTTTISATFRGVAGTATVSVTP